MKYSSTVLSALAAFVPSYCSAAVYVADITEINGSGVSGKVGVFLRDGGVVGYTGRIYGLEANLGTADCTAPNGCGIHIHSGYGCSDSASQGGHFFATPVTSDPWDAERYTSDSDGQAFFSNFVDIGTDDVADRAFVVHNQAGARVGCGLLNILTDNSQYLTVQTKPFGAGSTVEGNVEFYNDGSGAIMLAGSSTGLESNLLARSEGGSDCTAPNGCGIHIHSGSSCEDTSSQGGHLYDPNIVAVDPWLTVGYTSTDDSGAAHFIYTVDQGVSNVDGRAFLIHNNAGARVSCGIMDGSSNVPSINGDPHIRTWAGMKYDFHGVCDLVMLKNPDFQEGVGMDIHIRTKPIQGKFSYVSSVAVRIGNDTLEVMGDAKHENLYWINKQPNADLEQGINGNSIEYRKVNSKQHEYTVELEGNMKVVLKTWNKFVRVNIFGATKATFGTSLGLLGSYRSSKLLGRDNSTNFVDTDMFGQEWQVLPSDGMLFHNVEGPQAPKQCDIPHAQSLRRRLAESEVSEKEAEIACARVNRDDFGMCVFDVMATGAKDVVGAY